LIPLRDSMFGFFCAAVDATHNLKHPHVYPVDAEGWPTDTRCRIVGIVMRTDDPKDPARAAYLLEEIDAPGRHHITPKIAYPMPESV